MKLLATSEIHDRLTQTNEAGWLDPHRKTFIEQLSADRYSRDVIRLCERTIDCFCTTVAERSLDSTDIQGPVVEDLRNAVLRTVPESTRSHARFCLGRFLQHLVGAGAAKLPARPVSELTAMDRMREEYDAYLRHQRGMSEATIYHCMRFLERFVTFRFGKTLGDLNSITPDDIVAFLCQTKKGSQPYRDKTPPTHLRNLFKFLFWSEKTKRNLATSIPRVAQPQPINLPRYLTPGEVQQLIDAVRTDDAIGRRNYAMLMLIARLGLRAPEVIAIQLEDIDWRAGEILIRGKGKLHDRMPLPADAGEVVVDYIRNARVGNSRVLFVSARAPYRAFRDGQILNYVLRDAFKKTGLKPPQKYVGSHLLRHSLATDMLRNGASLDEIGDVLRHRSRMTTTIYAKHDIEALRSVARVWPAQGGGR